MIHALTLAAITWDPFIRGVLIVAVAVIVLPGSVYLILATDTGARVGFMIAMCGLFGWIFVMAVVWAVFGIGDVGRTPSWKTLEVITGDTNQSTVLTGFPGRKWKTIQISEPEFADVSSSADKVLASSAAAAPTPGKEGGAPAATRFPPPFSTPDQYMQIAHFRKDDTTVWHIRKHKFTPWGHDKHVDVVQVRPVLPQPDTGGAPAPPTADPSKPVTTVVLMRDLGSVRQPPIFIAIASFVIFGLFSYLLHRRDKEIWAAKAAAEGGGAGATGDRQLAGAGAGRG